MKFGGKKFYSTKYNKFGLFNILTMCDFILRKNLFKKNERNYIFLHQFHLCRQVLPKTFAHIRVFRHKFSLNSLIHVTEYVYDDIQNTIVCKGNCIFNYFKFSEWCYIFHQIISFRIKKKKGELKRSSNVALDWTDILRWRVI